MKQSFFSPKMKILFAFLVILISLIFIAPQSGAQQKNQNRKIITVPQNEVIQRDYLAAGDVIEINGTIFGDVLVAGGQVFINGVVNGDLIAAGGDVNISGTVTQNVRAVGGNITVSGEVGRNITMGSGNIEFTPGAKINGSLIAGAGNITLSAPIVKDVYVGAGNLTISNSVGGDVGAAVGSLRLSSNAKIGGNLTYWSDEIASMADSAVVSGVIKKNTQPELGLPKSEDFIRVFDSVGAFIKLVSFVSTLAVGLLLIYFFPKYTEKVVSSLTEKPLLSLLLGFIIILTAPVIFIILLITVVGIPLALILFSLYLISLYISRIFAIIWIGLVISRKINQQMRMGWIMIFGLAVYYLISLIPLFGSLLTIFLLLTGIGAVFLTKKELYLNAKRMNSI